MIIGAIPSGIHTIYEANIDIIEGLVKAKAGRCINFPGETWQDAAQQVRSICLEALTKFDMKRYAPKLLYGYLAKCIDNRLYNLYRGLYLDNNPPCNRCELWERTAKVCLVLGSGCERITSYRERIKQKRQIHNPQSIDFKFIEDDDETCELQPALTEPDPNGLWELDTSIRTLLSRTPNADELLYFYEKLKDGETIPKDKHKQLQNLLEELRP